MPESPPKAAGVDLQLLRSGIFLMALRALGDPEAAEEVAQESLSRAVDVIRSPGATANLGAYVAGIARHVIADHFRAKERVGSLSRAAFEAVRDESLDPLTTLCSEEEVAGVRGALAGLAPADRELVTLCYFDDLSPTEIAKRLGVPPERIRQRKLRALQRLRAVFDRMTSARHAEPSAPTDRTGIAGTKASGSGGGV
jgi:RNA polymerase sigma factor (sigma-70 family)